MTTTEMDQVVANLTDLAEGAMKMVKVDGHRVCLVRTSGGVHAIDHACPHEGYGLTQGELNGELLTCAWHNWKFRVTDGSCVQGEEGVTVHAVDVDDVGDVRVTINRPDPEVVRQRTRVSLRSGIERDYTGQVARDVVRLLQASENPGELIWEAVAYGAPRAEFGWGHAIASATDCLSMLHLYDGDQRALPLVQGIAGIAEEERGRPVNPLPRPAAIVVPEPAADFRRFVEAEQVEPAQAVLLGAIEAGWDAERIRPWFTEV
ncbi:MAG: Rieske 2Fe-2S domain-containing protein, partial [Ilumatobacteraceae bacterium]